MIHKELVEQAVDKPLSSSDERLRLFGDYMFRSQTAEAAHVMCCNPILNEIAALESKLGGVSFEFFESAISLLESRLTQLENDRRQLMQQIKEVVIEIRQLKIVEPNEVESK